MLIERLEDLDAWCEARILAKFVYQIIRNIPKIEQYNIVKHMRECARSIPANIAEGFGRYNYQESMQFYRIARGSLNELKSDCYLSLDNDFVFKEDFEKAMDQIEKVNQLLNGLIRSTSRRKAQHLSRQANNV